MFGILINNCYVTDGFGKKAEVIDENGPDPSAGGSPYALPPTSGDFQFDAEATTVFGPPVPTQAKKAPRAKATTVDSLTVTEEFATNDVGTAQPTTARTSTKHDYNDYEDVTIPPNLTDLLANLPDDINADSLQKMFRDSVIDRKVLLESMDMLKKEMMKESAHVINPHVKRVGRSGEKVDQIKVDWMSARHRDQPIPADSGERKENTTTTVVRRDVKNQTAIGPPLIAGQLMIYELDEEPPMDAVEKQNGKDSECFYSHSLLFWASAGLGGLSVALLMLLLLISIKYLRLTREKDTSFSSPRRHLTAHET
ncbi:unnamed protein product, partial [Mesorhabditis spiculigera]